MAKTHECTIGNLRQGTMRYIATPHFVQNFRADMNSIGATWGSVANQGSWIFKPEYMEQVKAWARLYFPVIEAALVVQPEMSEKEAWAVAMGRGIRQMEDLND